MSVISIEETTIQSNEFDTRIETLIFYIQDIMPIVLIYVSRQCIYTSIHDVSDNSTHNIIFEDVSGCMLTYSTSMSRLRKMIGHISCCTGQKNRCHATEACSADALF